MSYSNSKYIFTNVWSIPVSKHSEMCLLHCESRQYCTRLIESRLEMISKSHNEPHAADDKELLQFH